MNLQNKKPIKSSSVVFYIFHFPLIALLAIVFGIVSVVPSGLVTKANQDSNGVSVLGDDDDGDDDSDDDDDDNDDDSDDDNDDDNDDDSDDDDNDDDSDDDSDDDDDNDDNDDNDDDNNGANDDDNNKSGNSGRRYEEIEDENENEFEDDADLDEDSDDMNEDEDNNENERDSESEVKILNPDGTYSIVKVKNDGKEFKKEIKTFDASGNKLKVEKYEGNSGEQKSRVVVYDASGNKLSDIRLETEDGKELELRVKEGETELSRIKFDAEHQELLVKSEDSVFGGLGNPEDVENALKIKLVGNQFMLTRKGIDALSKFPMVVDDSTGAIYVQTPSGEIKLGAMPDTIIQTAQSSTGIDDVSDLVLENTDSSETPLEFRLTGTKSEKLLGIFSLKIPTAVIFDAETGDFVRSEESFMTKVLDLFSF